MLSIWILSYLINAGLYRYINLRIKIFRTQFVIKLRRGITIYFRTVDLHKLRYVYPIFSMHVYMFQISPNLPDGVNGFWSHFVTLPLLILVDDEDDDVVGDGKLLLIGCGLSGGNELPWESIQRPVRDDPRVRPVHICVRSTRDPDRRFSRSRRHLSLSIWTCNRKKIGELILDP